MIKKLFKLKLRQSGIALLVVLASVALLMALVVEFAYNSHIYSSMAKNDLDRLKAYYFARSAMNFAKLQIKIEKDIRKQLEKYSKHLEGVIGSEPICKLMPFSSGMLREAVGGFGTEGGEAEEGEGEEGETEESGGEATGKEGQMGRKQGIEGIMAATAAKDFLAFEGDFSVSCDVEDRKINLNYFFELNPQDPVPENIEVNAYENHKRLVESLLTGAEFEELSEQDPLGRRRLADNLADWVDKNNLVDESPGLQAGYEDEKYPEGSYSVKNGKFSTPGEILLVAGMGDDIYRNLIRNVTIYGDDKVNICLAEEAMIKAFVIRYSNVSEEIDPILPDNDELLDGIVNTVQQACLKPNPKANEVANAIRTALNLKPEASKPPPKDSGTKEKGTPQEKGPTAVPTRLTDQIVTENRFYSFDLTGRSGDIILNIKAVMNVEDKDPNKWKLLFYRVE